MKKLAVLLLTVFTLGTFSCVNDEWQFPDFDFQSVYFAHQYPVRTITLGDDIVDTTLDNEWKFKVMATTGGVYTNRQDLRLEIEYDPKLVEGLLFSEGGEEILALPSEYFQMPDNYIVIPRGEIIGGVEVQLTGAFFNDPRAIRNTYVVPLRIKNVDNADTILVGSSPLPNPNPHVLGDWDVTPKDFVLYAVKYINEWHGTYLRRGVDVITGKQGNEELSGEVVRKNEFVEQDELNDIITSALNRVEFPLTFQGDDGIDIEANLLLTFDNNGNCTISSTTEGVSVLGSGQFVKKGEKKSWGNQDRDALYLKYEIDFPQMTISSTDTLVLRNRGVAFETFTPVLK